MTKKYMVGTLDDYPLLMVELDGISYFVNERNKEVFEDKPGLPIVTDKETSEAVLKKAEEL